MLHIEASARKKVFMQKYHLFWIRFLVIASFGLAACGGGGSTTSGLSVPPTSSPAPSKLLIFIATDSFMGTYPTINVYPGHGSGNIPPLYYDRKFKTAANYRQCRVGFTREHIR